tara:strand:- start:246 stop:791 length:546 start_codon:yes stop_codon:yes gene_type:complete
MPDYSKAKIYKIECNITNEVYYGSTIQSLGMRLAIHKYSKKCRAINIIDRGNFNMKVLEEYPCNSKKELETRERWWIENNVCINKIIPTRTTKEYRQDNREKLQVYFKQHTERKREYDKKYRDDNIEKIKQRKAEYYFKNQADINAKQNEVIKCECGCEITKSKLPRHRRTKKHADLLNQA